MTNETIKVPRMAPGKGFAGPEYVGCCNSGKRIVILNSKAFGTYLVGTELSVDRAHELGVVIRKLLNGRRVVRFERHEVVYQFKTRAGAVNKFRELNQQVLNFNRMERERIAKYNDAVKRGDMAAAVQYAD